jgi:hypothetical protein
VGSPVVANMSCSSTATLDTITTTVAATTGGLQCDATSGQYTYVWKTAKGSTGCVQLDVKLGNGTDHVAQFRFK